MLHNGSKTIALNTIGTIIGAGVFGLPVVFAKTGLFGGSLLFCGVLLVAIALHSLLVRIGLAVRGDHHIPGYAGKAFGRWGERFALSVLFCKTTGTTLAYIILGGEFLAMIARGIGIHDGLFVWQVVFWAVSSFVVYFGLKFVAEVEDELTWLLVGFMVFTVAVLFPFFDANRIPFIDTSSFASALGVIFFSVTAMTVIPDMVALSGRKAETASSGVLWGTIGAGVVSWAFGMAIALAGPEVRSVADIQHVFPPIFWWLLPSIGLLAVATSFLTIVQSVKGMLHEDAGMGRTLAWIVAVATPFLLFLFVSRDFLKTIGFVGGVLTVMNGLIVCASAYAIFRGKPAWRVWRLVPIPLVAILLSILFLELRPLLMM